MTIRSNKWLARLGAALALLASTAGWSQAGEPLNAASYIRERGWTVVGSPLPRSPNADLVPLQYYEKSAYAPSCGLLGRAANGKPQLVELAGPGEGSDWPQCMDIESMTAVRLGDRDYVAVVYLVRDTREDFYRYVEYVHADPRRVMLPIPT
ncbi:hypothetical protein [Pseudoduganella lutea]|uniref:Uncharacterized protein n=1 Tax=Pseudoduganella lutea TaxID=321985 RepID=A0A4V0Z473_9BURK|nr:hypothetical protein [Pseudoduganella lutea]QBE65943.1 hypothetical protein EWM63_25595 [Pseudoduganella lutea]